MADAHEGKSHVSIVVAGHVDAGKSSLTGRLLYDLGGINEREMEKLRKIAEENGKPSFAFAYFMDNQKAERERGITIACNTKEFYTDRYHYTIIDAPGHRDFIKNMITGSSQADVALLLCPADGGSFIASIAKGDHKTGEVPGQTRNHARLLNLLGVKQLIVGVNKMDSLDSESKQYSEARYEEVAKEMKRILLQEGWKKEQIESEIPIIPMAGFLGENILKKSDKMPWWKGQDIKVAATGDTVKVECLLDALNKMVNLPPRNVTAPLRAPVSQCLGIKGVGDVLTMRIEQGEVNKGDEVIFLPTHTASNPCTGKVFSIEMHHKEHSTAGPGDNVGINMKGLNKANMPKGGDVMIKKSDPTLKTCDTFVAQSMVLDHPGQIKVGYCPVAYCRTSKCSLRLEKINWKVGKKSTGGQKVENPEFIEKGDMCELVFKPARPFVVDSHERSEGLSRIAILEGATVAMIAKVTAVTFQEEIAKKK
jgi:elongation factor 1-alpha